MADSAPALVRELKRVLLPTLGSPTIPNFIFIFTCSETLVILRVFAFLYIFITPFYAFFQIMGAADSDC